MIVLKYTAGGNDYAIALDATLVETHGGDVQITESPVERGANPTDHARPKPETLKVEALVCDYPLESAVGESSSYLFVPGPGRAAAIVSALKAARGSTLFEVLTGVETYADMLIESLSETRDKSISSKPPKDTSLPPYRPPGTARKLSLSFRQVRIVGTDTVATLERVSTPGAQQKVDKGRKDAQAATEAELDRSLLRRGELSAPGQRAIRVIDSFTDALKKRLPF